MSAAENDVDVAVAAGSSRGVLNAPVLCFCKRSKISCSSFGSRGGAGAFSNGEE